MAYASIADLAPLVNQQEFADSVAQEIKEKSRFIRAGIAGSDPIIASKCANMTGKTVELPFFNALGGTTVLDEEVMEEGVEPAIDGIDMGTDQAVKTIRIKAWGANDLAGILSAADPLAVIRSSIAEWKIRASERKLFATLDGIFGVSAMQALVLDLTANTTEADQFLGKHTFGRAAQLLGERKLNLDCIVCNSEVEQYLQEIDTEANRYVPSQAGATLPSYNGRTLITDDACKIDQTKNVTVGTGGGATTKSVSDVAEIYLFGKGAIAYNDCPSKDLVAFEAGRDILKSRNFVVTRSADIMHVRGVKWTGTAYASATYGSGDLSSKQPNTPRNSDLATAANWSMVYPKEYIRCVKIIARIG